MRAASIPSAGSARRWRVRGGADRGGQPRTRTRYGATRARHPERLAHRRRGGARRRSGAKAFAARARAAAEARCFATGAIAAGGAAARATLAIVATARHAARRARARGARARLPRAAREADRADARRSACASSRPPSARGRAPPGRPRAALHRLLREACTSSSRAARSASSCTIDMKEHVALLAHDALLRAREVPQPRDRRADPAREDLPRPRPARLVRGRAPARASRRSARCVTSAPSGAPAGAPARCTRRLPGRRPSARTTRCASTSGPTSGSRALAVDATSRPIPSREARRARSRRGATAAASTAATTTSSITKVLASSSRAASPPASAVHGSAREERRTIRISGTRGELRGVLHDGVIEVSRHGSLEAGTPRDRRARQLGHFGGDDGLLDHFTEVLGGGDLARLRSAERSRSRATCWASPPSARERPRASSTAPRSARGRRGLSERRAEPTLRVSCRPADALARGGSFPRL